MKEMIDKINTVVVEFNTILKSHIPTTGETASFNKETHTIGIEFIDSEMPYFSCVLPRDTQQAIISAIQDGFISMKYSRFIFEYYEEYIKIKIEYVV